MSPTRHRCRFLALDLPDGSTIPGHVHATHQLLRVDHGAVEVAVPGSSWVVPADGGVWLPGTLRHEIRSLADSSGWFLYIDAPVRWPVPAAGPVTVPPLLHQLIAEAAQPLSRTAEADRRRKRLEAVLLDQLADLAGSPLLVPLPRDPAAREVAVLLLRNPDDGRSLSKLATAAGIGTRTLQRRFADETGLTFQAWRRRARLQVACTLLAGGESVGAVAHHCGFASASSFVAAFRHELHTTPGAWVRASTG